VKIIKTYINCAKSSINVMVVVRGYFLKHEVSSKIMGLARKVVEAWDHLHSGVEFCRNFRKNIKPEHFLPDHRIEDITELDPQTLRQERMQGGMFDLDQSLSEMHAPSLDDRLGKHLRKITKYIKAVVVSNCSDERFHQIGTRVLVDFDVCAIKVYEKNTWNNLLRRITKKKDDDKETVCAVYHQGKLSYHCFKPNIVVIQGVSITAPKLTKIGLRSLKGYRRLKKPHRKVIQYALAVINVTNPNNAFFLGDRGLTDISGGNQYRGKSLGIPYKVTTYQVEPFGDKEKRLTKFTRWFERKLTARYARQGHEKAQTAPYLNY
jgi:predicted HAD superfamily phosphohydrolase YqeG